MTTKTPTFTAEVTEALTDLPIQFAIGVIMLPGYYGNCYAVANVLGLDAEKFIEKAGALEKACDADTAAKVLAWLKKIVEPMEERYDFGPWHAEREGVA